ncbi:unnamed protein product [Parajaminaea phylloscopi]
MHRPMAPLANRPPYHSPDAAAGSSNHSSPATGRIHSSFYAQPTSPPQRERERGYGPPMGRGFDHPGHDHLGHDHPSVPSAYGAESTRSPSITSLDDEDTKGVGSSSGHHHSAGTAGQAQGKANGDKARSGLKRQRVHFSCTECHRRKQKCNRQTPCQHCIARKVPDRCKTFQPGQDETIDLSARVSRIERAMEDGFDRIMGLLQSRTASHPPQPPQPPALPLPRTSGIAATAPPTTANDPTCGSDAGDEANAGGEINALGNFHGSGSTVAMRIDSLLSDVGEAGGSRNSTAKDVMHGQSTLIAMPMRSGPDSGDPNNCDLDSRFVQFGMNDVSKTFTSSMPRREICLELIDHFFTHVNWIRHPLPEKLVRPQLEQYLAVGRDTPSPTHAPLSASNINAFACLSLIVAMAVLSTDSEAFPASLGHRRLIARKFEFMGRRSLLMSQVIGRDDVLQVLGFNLAWRFLMLDRRMNEAWRCSTNAVAAGYAIGLHRDGSKLRLPTPDTELRRCVWAQIVFADLLLAGTLGRPPISDLDRTYTDTQAPSLEGIKYWWPYDESASHPKLKADIGMPTIYQHMLQREAFNTEVWRKIVEIYQKLTPHHYSDVLAADAELLRVPDELPHYFRAQVDSEGNVECDRSLDDDLPFLRIHRFLIHSDLYFARIALHRSYLLRSGAKGSSGRRFVPSREACVDSALKDLALRADFVEQLRQRYGRDKIPRLYYAHIGSFAWFNSLLIACIAAVLDPHIPEIPTLRTHLDRFLQSHEMKKKGLKKGELEGVDDVREREVTIIAMFVQAIDRARSAPPAADDAAASATASAGADGKGAKEDGNRGRKRARGADSPTTAGRAKSRDKSRGARSGQASREETTADVLLDLGKHRSGDGVGKQNATAAATTTASGRARASSSLSRTLDPSRQRSGDDAAGAGVQRPGHLAEESNMELSRSHSSLPTIQDSSPVVDSPQALSSGLPSSVPGSMAPTGRSSHLVDSAQADFNAWFQMEFAGGAGAALADSTLNGVGNDASVLGLGSGTFPAGMSNGRPFGSPLQNLDRSAVAGWNTDGSGGTTSFSSFNVDSTGQMQGGAFMSEGLSAPAPVQWSTLPRPIWDDGNGAGGATIASAAAAAGEPGAGALPGDYRPKSSLPDLGLKAVTERAGSFGGDGVPSHLAAATQQQQQQWWQPEHSNGPMPPSWQPPPSSSSQQQPQGPEGSLGGSDPSGNSAGGGGNNGNGNGNGNGTSFDPGFWADLIHKIST